MSRIVSAIAAGIVMVAATSLAHAQGGPVFTVGVMNWSGGVAQAPVEVANTAPMPMRPTEMACEFIAVGRVVGLDRKPVPALGPGERVTVSVMADTGGQLVDAIRCQLL